MRFVKLSSNVPFTSGGSKVVRINLGFVQSIAELPGGSEITFSSGKTLVVTESAEAIIGKQEETSLTPEDAITDEQVERMGRIAKELKEQK